MAAYYIEALLWRDEEGGDELRWNIGAPVGTSVSVTYSFLTAPAPHAGGDALGFEAFTAAQESAAAAVLALYAEVANISFEFLADDAAAQILFGNNDQTGTAGYAFAPSTEDPKGGDVYLDENLAPNQTELAPGQYGYWILTHEIGHALGLKHPEEGTPSLPPAESTYQHTVMATAQDLHPHSLFFEDGTPRTIYPSGPMLYDIAAIQHLYGANMTTRTGDDVYVFDPGIPFFECIWDAGGTDTISVENFMLGCEIDLRAGHFSSISIPSDEPDGETPTYDGTDNLAIAFAVTIENAVGGEGDDTLTGNDSDNTLEGGAGNDTINGLGGIDTVDYSNSPAAVVVNLGTSTIAGGGVTVAGGTARDGYGGTDRLISIESVLGTDFSDTIAGSTASNHLAGRAGADRIAAGAGNDTLVGGAGNDTLAGGAGNDTYDGVEPGDVVSEAAASGLDTIRIALTYILGANLENLVLTGSDDANGTGNALNNALTGNGGLNVLTGHAGNDTLIGDGGSDTLVGGAGADRLLGGDGDDLLLLGSVADYAGDFIDGGMNGDTLRYTGAAAATLTLNASVLGMETVQVLSEVGLDNGAINVDASAVQNSLKLVGNAGNNRLIGTASSDEIQGEAGNDVLDGRADDDRLVGGAGNDVVLIVQGDHHGAGETVEGGAGDNFIRFTRAAGTDLLVLSEFVTGIKEVEAGDAAGMNTGMAALSINASAVGNALIVTGNNGANVLIGTAFDDSIAGNAGNDTLTGTAGMDTLNGGPGIDLLAGGDGNDLYIVDSAADSIVEDDADDMDSVLSTVTFSLAVPAHELLENLTLSGALAINGTGNALDNMLAGNAAANRLTGGLGNDTLEGRGGNDTLNGDGIDTLPGGNDTADYSTAASAVNVNLGSGIATGSATGTDRLFSIENALGSPLNDVLTGSAGPNALEGRNGNDTLAGGAEADTLDGGAGADTGTYAAAPGAVDVNLGPGTAQDGSGGTDTLVSVENATGSLFDDVLSGNADANVLEGGAGDDTLYGYDAAGVNEAVSSIIATRIAEGLSAPIFAGAPGDDLGRLFVVEKAGVIKIVDLGTNEVLPTPFIDLTTEIDDQGEQGLLGLAFHPDFAENGYFYVNLISTDPEGDTVTEIRRYQVSADPDVADAASGTQIITIDQPNGFSNHKAGWLGFGPDGFLYAALGDGGGSGDPLGSGQDITSLLGKMLRLNVDGDAFPGDAGRNYAIPTGNMFVGAFGEDEIWAMGLRNPWRNGFDRETGQLYIADVGQGTWEEVNLGQAGANYGWDNREGPDPFPGGEPLAGDTTLVNPIHSYGRDIGQSITGGYVYRGPAEALQGHYFFADFMQSRIFTLHFDGDSWDVIDRTAQIVEDVGTINSPSSFGEDGLGNLYVVDIGGEIFRLMPDASGTDAGDTLRGAAGNDALLGGPGNDMLDGGAGMDAQNGGGGDDIILVARPADHPVGEVIDGGGGEDTIRFTSVTLGDMLVLRNVINIDNVVIGNAAGVTTGTTTLHVDASSLTQNVTLTGNAGINTLIAGSGDDTLIGAAGRDDLRGGAGNDLFLLGTTTHFPAGERIQGGDGSDTLRYTGTSAATLTLTNLVTGIEEVELAAGTATISVNAFALANGIKLTSNNGNNSLTGTNSADTIIGGEGNDTLNGNAGTDELDAGAGDDIIVIGAATHSVGETIVGGDGNDTIRFTATTAGQTLTLGAGAKEIETVVISNLAGSTAGTLALHVDASDVATGLALIGNAGANRLEGTIDDDVLNGGAGRDTLIGGEGNDTFLIGNGHFAAGEAIQGGEGDDDSLYFTTTTASTSLTLNAGVTGLEVVQISTASGVTTGTTVASINASAVTNALEINGNNGHNTLVGTVLADTLIGNGGNDVLAGGGGADALAGGAGNDTLVWDAADAGVQGGEGTDTLRIDGKNVTVDLVGNETITGIEVISLTGSGNNRLSIGSDDVLAITTGGATGTLRIEGNLGDEVELQGEWVQGASVKVGSVFYRSYSEGGATVLINPAMPAVTPVGDSIAPTGNDFIDGLTQGGAWKFAGQRVITYSLDRNFDGLVAAWPAEWITAVDNAFAAWESLIDVDFQRIGIPATTTTGVVQNQSTANISLALAPGEGGGFIAALGVFPDPQFANLLLSELGYSRSVFPRPEGDIVFDNLFFDFSNLQPGSSGFEIVLHEIGHALGLKHSDDDGANGRPNFAQLGIGNLNNTEHTLMMSGVSDGAHASTPMLLDVLAIQHIYGANASHYTGDDTYAWSGSHRTIWDAGGTDTFDASFSLSALTIDLQPGGFSGNSGPLGSRNNAIAFGTIIENATSGSGSDLISGNDANNNISSGSGQDTIQGGPGSDTLSGEAGNDSLIGGDGADSMDGGGENDFLTGDAGADWMTGGNGNDSLVGGAGIDSMSGGSGNDMFNADDTEDAAIEAPGEGEDHVLASASFVLAPNVERLTLTGAADIDGTGNSERNSIRGNSGGNVLSGGGEFDALAGGAGDDTYILTDILGEPGFYGFSISFSGPPGEYISQGLSYQFDTSTGQVGITAVDSPFFDPDTLVDIVAISYSGGSDSFSFVFHTRSIPAPFDIGTYAVVNPFEFEGFPGMDISGNGRGGSHTGSFEVTSAIFDYTGSTPSIVDLSIAFEQHDGGSPLALTGSLHVYKTLTDDVVELEGGGLDTVQAGITYALPRHVEILELTGTVDIDGTGNELDNLITGNDGVNVLDGAAGADTVDGGAGADMLKGGAGDDILVWDPADASVQGGTGTDTLRMGGTDEPLDLTEIADGVITDVEIIDLLGSGSNLLTLTVADVLAISSETDMLRVDGDVADTVAMGSGWTDGGVADGYHTWTQGLATLLIDTEVTQNVA